MSQRDLVAELHGARIPAPAHVREHVRQIVAGAPAAPRRFTWRRAFVVAVPAFAAVAAAVLITRPDSQQTATPPAPVELQAQRGAVAKSFGGAGTATGTPDAIAPAPAPGRVSRYGAFLSLRVKTANGVSNGVKRALRVATSLGGFSTSVHASTEGKAATADLTLRIPRAHIQEAISRLSALGTITGEQVDVQDLTSPAERRRPHDRAAAEAARDTPCRDADRRRPRDDRRRHRAHRAAAAAAGHDRARRSLRNRAAAPRDAAHRPTKHGHGPLHGLGVAFHWIGIGAVYALALGAPLLLLIGLAWSRAGDPPAPRRRAAQPLICANTRNVGSPTGSSLNSGLTQPRSRRARLVGPLDLGAAHRQRVAHRTDRTEAGRVRLGRAGACRGRSRPRTPSACSPRRCGPTPRTSRRTGTPREARAGVDDLVAVDVAATALHLVLRMEWQRRCGGLLWGHGRIVGAFADDRKT